MMSFESDYLYAERTQWSYESALAMQNSGSNHFMNQCISFHSLRSDDTLNVHNLKPAESLNNCFSSVVDVARRILSPAEAYRGALATTYQLVAVVTCQSFLALPFNLLITCCHKGYCSSQLGGVSGHRAQPSTSSKLTGSQVVARPSSLIAPKFTSPASVLLQVR